ncbi:hypothetical protein JCM10213_007317 [Rhodosporidiobolus nylandii]
MPVLCLPDAAIKWPNLALLLIFAFSSGVWHTSLSGIWGNLAAYAASLFTLASLLFVVWAMLPAAVAKWKHLHWALLTSAIGCGASWFFVCQQGNGAMVCNGLSFMTTVCGWGWMEYVFYALYFISFVLQLFYFWLTQPDGTGGSLLELGQRRGGSSSSARARRQSVPVEEAWSSGSESEGSSEDDEAKVGLNSAASGRSSGRGKSAGGAGASSASEEEPTYARVQTRSRRPAGLAAMSSIAVPSLDDSVDSHRTRAAPRGDLNPMADVMQDIQEQGGMKLDDGTEFEPPHPEGDSPVHTHVHLPHGSKEQEDLEEKIKLTLGKKDD